jgi:hypothetical protein
VDTGQLLSSVIGLSDDLYWCSTVYSIIVLQMETGGQLLSSVIGLFYEPEYETAPYTVLSQERENVSFFLHPHFITSLFLFFQRAIAENCMARIKKLNSTEYMMHFLYYTVHFDHYVCSFVSICIYCNSITEKNLLSRRVNRDISLNI